MVRNDIHSIAPPTAAGHLFLRIIYVPQFMEKMFSRRYKKIQLFRRYFTHHCFKSSKQCSKTILSSPEKSQFQIKTPDISPYKSETGHTSSDLSLRMWRQIPWLKHRSSKRRDVDLALDGRNQKVVSK